MTSPVNDTFTAHLTARAQSAPGRTALICPRRYGRSAAAPSYTYEYLEEESELLARGMLEAGITPGMRALFMVQPSVEFFTLAFGLFKAGGVLVGLDPSMGPQKTIRCAAEADAGAFIAVPLAHAARRLAGWGRGTVSVCISTARRTSKRSGQISYTDLREMGRRSNLALPRRGGQDPAVIAFTSGSTGSPKGVVYRHGLLNAQVEALRECFSFEDGERDLVTFPHFAFFGPGLGATLVLADMDFSHPGRANPSRIVQAIQRYGITNMFGSPALLDRVGRYGEKRGIKLPSLKRVVSAGATVAPRIVDRISNMLEGGAFLTPYGATEALPVSCITGTEILTETQRLTDDGHGVCVGQPVTGVDVRIIRISDAPIKDWSEDLEVAPGEIGEIAVAGAVVSDTYFQRPQPTAEAKIRHGDRSFHRMGDLGYMDADGRLWFCGRKTHRVKLPDAVHFTVPVESVFNSHPDVCRSALVRGHAAEGQRRPVLCVELNRGVAAGEWDRIRRELLDLAARRPLTAAVHDILRPRRFPVDTRHNAKIHRERLTIWAERQLS